MAKQACDRVRLEDLNHLQLRGDMDGSKVDGTAVRAHVGGRRLTLWVQRSDGTEILRFSPGSPQSFLERVNAMRRAAGADRLDVNNARRLMAHAGYSLDDHRVRGWPWVEPSFPSQLRALHGTCTSSGDGACQLMFFFLGNHYLGTDASTSDASVGLLWQSKDTVALAYAIWRRGDSVCCPSGGRRIVRLHWNGTELVPLDPLPRDPNA